MSGSSDPTETFRQEARDLLETLEQTLLDLGQAPDNRDLVDASFRAMHTLSQLLCRFIKKFLQDFSRMKRSPTWVFTFRFQFFTRVSTSERLGQKMGFRNRGAAGS